MNMTPTKPAVRQIIAIVTGRGGGRGCVAMDKADHIHLYRELSSEILVDFMA